MLMKFGRYGVELFFMISGFVIFWTLQRVDNLRQFIWSRFSRLYPTYWVAMCLTFMVLSFYPLDGRNVSLETFFVNFTMLQSYLGFNHVDGVYWTLMIEMAFYFWMGLIFISGQMKHLCKILIIWNVVNIIIFINVDTYAIKPLEDFFLIKNLCYFSLGIVFFKIWQGRVTQQIRVLAFVSIAGVLAFKHILVFIEICIFMGVFYLVVRERLAILSHPVLVYLGGISYSLYLLHQNIGYAIIHSALAANWPMWLAVLTALICSLLLAHTLNRLVEKPSLVWLRTISWPGKKSPLTQHT